MTKMKEFAALLGVEIGEEFQLADNDGVYAPVYRITEREVEYFNELINKWITYDLGINFVSDKRVTKKPWKPKKSETFFVCKGNNVFAEKWADCTADLMTFAVGNCFRTFEEAEAHRKEVIERLKKIYDDGKPLSSIPPVA